MRFVPAQRCTVMLQVFYCIELYQESIRQRNRTVYRNSNARIVFLPLFVKNSYKFEGLLFSLLSQIYTVSIELVKNICAISQVCVAKGRSKHAETHGRVFSQFFALPTRPYTAFFAGNSANARVSYHHISVSPFTTYKTHISQRIYYIFFALPNRHCKYRIDQKRVHNFLVCVLPRPKVPIQKLMVGFSFNPLLSQIGRTLHHLSVWRNSAVGKSKVTISTVKLYKTRSIRIITIDCYQGNTMIRKQVFFALPHRRYHAGNSAKRVQFNHIQRYQGNTEVRM